MRKITSIVLSLIMVFTMLSALSAFALVAEGETPTINMDSNGLTIEMEDYVKENCYKHITEKSSDLASGGKIVTAGYSSAEAFNKEVVHINVTEAAYFDVDAVLGFGSDDSNCIFQLKDSEGNDVVYFDNVESGRYNATLIDGLTGGDGCGKAYNVSQKGVLLEVGTYTLNFTVGLNTYRRYLVDYFRFTPKYKSVDVASAGTTTVEFEDYVKPEYENKVSTNTENENIKYITYHWTTISYPIVDIKANVSQAGKYSVDVLMGRSTEVGSYGLTTITLYNSEGTQIATIDNMSSSNDGVDRSGYASGNTLAPRLFNLGLLELPQGEITIKVMVKSTSNTYGSGYTPCLIDYMSFERLGGGGTVNISSTEATTIEYEHYVNSGSASFRRDANASGGWFVSNGWTGTDPSTAIDVVVEKSGVYDIEIIMGHGSAQSYGTHTVTINGAVPKIYEPTAPGMVASSQNANYLDNNYTTAITNYGPNSASGMPIKKFINKVYLNAGATRIVTNIANSSGTTDYNVYKFNLDCIKLIPSAIDNIAEDGGNVTITGNYLNEVSGTPIIALYNGDKLVNAVECAAVTDATQVTASIPVPAVAYTEAKLFVWDNTTTIVPQVVSKTFAK